MTLDKTVFRYDRGELRRPERTSQGFLKVEGRVARIGVYPYQRADGSIQLELRPEDEVFSPRALASYEGVPITLGHPPEDVTAENVKRYEVGSVLGPARRDGDYVVATLLIKDAKAIKRVEAGEQQLSPGYRIRLDETPGIHPRYGQYHAIQRGHDINHQAVVDRARGGHDIRLRLDDAELVLPANEPAWRSDMTQQNERAEIIREIWQLSAELTRHDSAEDLAGRSDAYILARRDSLREWKERERATRASAVRRSDAASVRAALRFDATPTDGEYREARARVFASGVPEMERDSWSWRVANHLAWSRARDRLLAETAAARLDSLGGEPQPNEMDRLHAARDLEGSVPLGAAGRADAYAAQRHERAIDARARELAGARVRAEAQAQALANMPAPPPEPRLPAAPLPHAYLRQEADAEERAARGPDTWPPRRRS